MDIETKNEIEKEFTEEETKQNLNKLIFSAPVVMAVILIVGITVYAAGNPSSPVQTLNTQTSSVLVGGGLILPLDEEEKILKILIENGTIDPTKLSKVTELNLLWALGLANKNKVLEDGPISDSQYGGPTNMASVGGFTVTDGSVMDHYSMHEMITLTPNQQKLVEKVAKGIYRPCCNNSTHFPDCNHGMAMLGLLEYLASQGATEKELWDKALVANMAWFPHQYQTIAKYMDIKGIDIKTVTPQELLGEDYSSASGFANISAQVPQISGQGGGSGCGIESKQLISEPPRQQQGGCGI